MGGRTLKGMGMALGLAFALCAVTGCGDDDSEPGGSETVDGGAGASGGGGASAGSGTGGGAAGETGGSGNGGSAGEGGAIAGTGSGGEAAGTGASGGAGTAGGDAGTGGVGASGGGDGGSGGGSFACPAAGLGDRLGKDRLLVGGSMDDVDFAAQPFDIRYKYLAGAVPAGGPCDSCASNCQVNGESCANTAGCEWWGCWQWDQDPPGRYAADLVQGTSGAGAVPMITYYIWYSVAGYVEGAAEIAALNNGSLMAAYLADFRFLCSVLAEAPAPPVILHLEPDLWGYAHQVNTDPSLIPAAVSAAGAAECSGFSDSVAGFARCLLAIARAEAPNVLVGFHASAWGAGHDVYMNSDPGFDVSAHAAETARFMRELGAAEADLIVVEMSDRDAGFNNRWWDDTDAGLPSFEQAISWVSQVGEGLGLAPLWWQVPYGHMGLDNTNDHYQDNRVDYFFDHPDRFARGGAIGIAFGAGAGGMTTPASDDGHFLSRAGAYLASQRPPLCGD